MKFYLSFENAYHCTDYISEKFWKNSFGFNLIPVVYGPHIDDVIAVAPPNSFIHAESFESPEELVKYLDYLDSNNTAYLEYHQWRTLYPSEVISGWPYQRIGVEYRTFCDLCRLIREKRVRGERQYYKSV